MLHSISPATNPVGPLNPDRGSLDRYKFVGRIPAFRPSGFRSKMAAPLQQAQASSHQVTPTSPSSPAILPSQLQVPLSPPIKPFTNPLGTFKPRIPKTYGGSHNPMVLNEWIAKMAVYLDLTGVDPKSIHSVQASSTYLIGRASTFYHQQVSPRPDLYPDFASLATGLRDFFLPSTWAFDALCKTLAEEYRCKVIARRIRMDMEILGHLNHCTVQFPIPSKYSSRSIAAFKL